MNLTELRKLVSQLNKDDRIVGVWKMKKPEIIAALKKVKYDIDEEKKQLNPSVAMKRKKIIKLPKN
tara:strand:+ start:2570 stop:2767 length:198 start_codon:yes stop_codon:yes gene_type:complete